MYFNISSKIEFKTDKHLKYEYDILKKNLINLKLKG